MDVFKMFTAKTAIIRSADDTVIITETFEDFERINNNVIAISI